MEKVRIKISKAVVAGMPQGTEKVVDAILAEKAVKEGWAQVVEQKEKQVKDKK